MLSGVRVTPSFHKKLRKSQLVRGDVLIVRVGANRGDVASVRGNVGPLNCANIIFARPFFDTGFLEYYLRSEIGREALLALTTGAAQGVINTGAVAQLPVPVAPEDTQRRIASILSAYDDLIENNTRRIAILEEMAQRLYEEWFVKFRFPGWEDVEFNGEKPSTWATLPLKEVARLKSGYAFKSGTFTEGGLKRLVTIKNVQDGCFDPSNVSLLDEIPSNVPNHCFLVPGDLLLSLTGNVGRVCVVYGGEFLLNQRVAKIEPVSNVFRSFIHFTFRDHAFRKRLENLATGVAQQNLSPVKTEEIGIVVPSPDLSERFEAFAGLVIDHSKLLYEQNAYLRAQRDLLLPKLVSGEIDVSEAAEQVAEVAA